MARQQQTPLSNRNVPGAAQQVVQSSYGGRGAGAASGRGADMQVPRRQKSAPTNRNVPSSAQQAFQSNHGGRFAGPSSASGASKNTNAAAGKKNPTATMPPPPKVRGPAPLPRSTSVPQFNPGNRVPPPVEYNGRASYAPAIRYGPYGEQQLPFGGRSVDQVALIPTSGSYGPRANPAQQRRDISRGDLKPRQRQPAPAAEKKKMGLPTHASVGSLPNYLAKGADPDLVAASSRGNSSGSRGNSSSNRGGRRDFGPEAQPSTLPAVVQGAGISQPIFYVSMDQEQIGSVQASSVVRNVGTIQPARISRPIFYGGMGGQQIDSAQGSFGSDRNVNAAGNNVTRTVSSASSGMDGIESAPLLDFSSGSGEVQVSEEEKAENEKKKAEQEKKDAHYDELIAKRAKEGLSTSRWA